MTTSIDVLHEGWEHIAGTVHAVLDGIDPAHLDAQLVPDSNSIAWLVWHLTRVQDDHVAGVAGTEQLWTANGWHGRFGLPFDVTAIGYGFTADEVAQVRGVSAEQYAAYYDDVHSATQRYLATLSDDDLDRVVDEDWDPPVTLAVRLVSVLNDDLQHAGQAQFLRGVLERR